MGKGNVEGPSRRWLAPCMMNRTPNTQRAELPDDQFLRPIVVEHIAALERVRLVRIVVVGVLADLDQGEGHQRFQEDHTRLSRDRVKHRGVGGNRVHEGITN
jgi:hypothetical protein